MDEYYMHVVQTVKKSSLSQENRNATLALLKKMKKGYLNNLSFRFSAHEASNAGVLIS